ncbi:hypothetical protein V8D89_009146 [Ganoderma adspersum]
MPTNAPPLASGNVSFHPWLLPLATTSAQRIDMPHLSMCRACQPQGRDIAKIRAVLPSVTNPWLLLSDPVCPYLLYSYVCNRGLTVGLSSLLRASPGSVGIVRAPVPMLRVHTDVEVAGSRITPWNGVGLFELCETRYLPDVGMLLCSERWGYLIWTGLAPEDIAAYKLQRPASCRIHFEFEPSTGRDLSHIRETGARRHQHSEGRHCFPREAYNENEIVGVINGDEYCQGPRGISSLGPRTMLSAGRLGLEDWEAYLPGAWIERE